MKIKAIGNKEIKIYGRILKVNMNDKKIERLASILREIDGYDHKIIKILMPAFSELEIYEIENIAKFRGNDEEINRVSNEIVRKFRSIANKVIPLVTKYVDSFYVPEDDEYDRDLKILGLTSAVFLPFSANIAYGAEHHQALIYLDLLDLFQMISIKALSYLTDYANKLVDNLYESSVGEQKIKEKLIPEIKEELTETIMRNALVRSIPFVPIDQHLTKFSIYILKANMTYITYSK